MNSGGSHACHKMLSLSAESALLKFHQFSNELWEDVWSSQEKAALIDSPFMKPEAVMKMSVVDEQEVRRLKGGLNTGNSSTDL